MNANVSLSLGDELVSKVQKIAVARDTTLTAMIRCYLEQVTTEHAATSSKRRDREALEKSFAQFRFRLGRRSGNRAHLYERT